MTYYSRTGGVVDVFIGAKAMRVEGTARPPPLTGLVIGVGGTSWLVCSTTSPIDLACLLLTSFFPPPLCLQYRATAASSIIATATPTPTPMAVADPLAAVEFTGRAEQETKIVSPLTVLHPGG